MIIVIFAITKLAKEPAMKKFFVFITVLAIVAGCNTQKTKKEKVLDFGPYVLQPVELKADMSGLDSSEKKVIALLSKAATYADSMFLYESAGKYASVYKYINDTLTKVRFKINFGPWDRFLDDVSFIDTINDKPLGANFYPADIMKSEFLRFKDLSKMSNYTFIRRNSQGKLYCVPYHVQFARWNDSVAVLLREAAQCSGDSAFSQYLLSRIEALKTDDYYKSDSMWLGLDSKIDFIFGPVEISEDRLFNLKAEHKALVLVKDTLWSQRMKLFSDLLVYLQKTLPVPEEYKRDEPGKASEIVVYDVVKYGGGAYAGQPDISGVYPFYHDFQVKYGVKNIQLKNALQAKFSATVQPIAHEIMVASQRKYVSDTAFFIITMMFDMANTLGPRYTVDKHMPVRKAMKDRFVVMDYMKSAVLSLFLIEQLYSLDYQQGEGKLIPGELKDYYYTFVVDMLRQIRWGTSNDYSLAYLVIYNYLSKNGVFSYIPSGQIIVHFEKLREVLGQLSSKILIIMGDGDYVEASKFIVQNSLVSPELENMINLMNDKKIPLDITVK